MSEQIEIATFLDAAMGRHDKACQQSVTMIARLRERRSALITAAVTGQIDVTTKIQAEVAA